MKVFLIYILYFKYFGSIKIGPLEKLTKQSLRAYINLLHKYFAMNQSILGKYGIKITFVNTAITAMRAKKRILSYPTQILVLTELN